MSSRERLANGARRQPLTATFVLFASLASGLVACGEAGSASEGVAAQSQAVLHGEVSGPEEDAVVMVESTSNGVLSRCTGTLLSPNVVITARHCVSAYMIGTFGCTSSGELTPGSKGGTIGPTLDPSVVKVRVGQTPSPAVAQATSIFATDTPTICRNDIAVVVLDTMLTDLPISSVRLGRGNTRGELLRVVGYGLDENRKIGFRRTRSGLEISDIGTSQFRPVGDAVPPRTFVTEGPALCTGDSGGPAFLESGATTAVWSQVVGECTSESARGFYTQIAPFIDALLVPAFEEAGTLPTMEGATEPGWGNPSGTGGTPSTGGTSSGGMSAGGSAGAVDPGMGGQAGDTGSGGSTGGTSGGNASGGSETSGGSEATGGNITAQGGEFTYQGPRKKGGCTCDQAGAERSSKEAWLAPLLLLLFGVRRRRTTLQPIPLRVATSVRPRRVKRRGPSA